MPAKRLVSVKTSKWTAVKICVNAPDLQLVDMGGGRIWR